MTSVPSSKPRLSREDVEEIIKGHNLDFDREPLILVGIRGYYLDSMGRPGINDRGLYDDAAFWITADAMLSFNFNTDPVSSRPGWGKGVYRGMASLMSGAWKYKCGRHRDTPAFTQADIVSVMRDGNPPYSDSGWFGINIHCGALRDTGSLGCQTIPPDQWLTFKDFGYNEIRRFGVRNFPYILIDEQRRRDGYLGRART